MEQIIMYLIEKITNIMNSFGIFSGFLLIILESMIPILPLGVFVALNVITFGNTIGFIVSWCATIIGCYIIFMLCRKLNIKKLKKFEKRKNIKQLKHKISNISLSHLVIIMAVPFTPAFLINIAAGLSNINPKKFFVALLIGKIPMIYFWTFIGKSFLESFSDITVLSQILFMLLISFLVSKIVNKFLEF